MTQPDALQREVELTQQTRLQLVQEDLVEEHVDAIVNAANSYLQHGGGLAGAIARHGGPQIQQESSRWVQQHGPVPHDRPAYTSAGSLTCRYIIHAVGPVWGSGDEDRKLSSAVWGSLAVADHLKLGTISIPAISTGIFGFPKDRAARVILQTVREYFSKVSNTGLILIRIVILDRPTLDAFTAAWDEQDFASQ
jgi:O-acetyl-ADP-ribose deacetylase (regulator of RNase III)